MDEKNKDLPLVVSEIRIEMQQLRQDFKGEMQEVRQQLRQDRQEMIQVFHRSSELVIDRLGEIKTEVKDVRTTVEKIDKRVATIGESLTGNTSGACACWRKLC